MFKVPDLLQWIVVATEPSTIDDIMKAPEDVLSLVNALEEVSSFFSSPRSTRLKRVQSLQLEYTLGGHIMTNPYHIPIVRVRLTRALPQLVPDIQEEVVDAFNEFIPLTSGKI